ncbi:MAG: DNA polymerase/3'-5' exonuclease PolX [Candidatus Dadabacteria bacterium]|nr:MAG: DNA polymerase/3'-5' exonuclease PolX [Candidatus Dadabacteria bacterium]
MEHSNAALARQFEQAADILEILGENPFRVRAYRNAARVINDQPQPITDRVREGFDPADLPGIGADLADKIREFTTTGHIAWIDDLRTQIPAGLLELLRLPGVGPKKVRALWQELGITDLDGLRAAAEAQKIQALPGFGKKTEQNILKALSSDFLQERRFLRPVGKQAVAPFLELLAAMDTVDRFEIAGSYRRGRETVGDIDVIITARETDAPAIMDALVAHPSVQDVLVHGPGKTSVVTELDIQIDFRVVAPESWGAALLYFTGSKAHNIVLRDRARNRGWKLNEFGLFDGKQCIASKTEAEIYDAFGLETPPPELRENRGEFEAAEQHNLPRLICIEDYRGNLHAHSTWSDGKQTLHDIITAARDEFHYSYWAATDHSKSLTVANGLDEDRVLQQIDEIAKLRETVPGIEILTGIECDILEDGTLDLPDEILSRLDVVIIAIHSKFNLSRKAQTERMLRAMDNPWITFVAHPTGRLLTRREGYAIDIERVIRHAAERGCFLELNASPWRLDLNDIYCREAAAAGVPITINTDAHHSRDLNNLEHGIAQARRGWLRADQVINTLPVPQLRDAIRRTKLA